MVICDIDGCILENLHRAHLVPTDKSFTPNWTAFNKACVNDEPIEPVVEMVKHLAKKSTDPIIFITSRGENVRNETAKQLFELFGEFSCRLVMREMDDHRDTIDYKRDELASLQHDFKEDSILIDDHPGIIEMAKVNFPQLNRVLVPSYDCTVIQGAYA